MWDSELDLGTKTSGNEVCDFIGIDYCKKINIRRWVKVICEHIISVPFFKQL